MNTSSQKQPPEVFYEKDVLQSFENFTGNHLCWSFFLIKLQTTLPESLRKISPLLLLGKPMTTKLNNKYFVLQI